MLRIPQIEHCYTFNYHLYSKYLSRRNTPTLNFFMACYIFLKVHNLRWGSFLATKDSGS